MSRVLCQVALAEGGYIEFEGEAYTSEVFITQHSSGFVCYANGDREPFIWSRGMFLPLKGLIEFTQRRTGSLILMEALILDEKVVGWTVNGISVHANVIEYKQGISLEPSKEVAALSVLERVLENSDF